MDQRIADILHHFAVEFDFAAARLESDFLAQLLRQIADDARQRREQRVDPLHPHLADRLPHSRDRIGQTVERGDQRQVRPRFAQHPGEFVAREHDVGDARHHAVEQRQRDADRSPALQIGAKIVLPAQRNARDFVRGIFVRPAFGERADDVAVVARRFGSILPERSA